MEEIRRERNTVIFQLRCACSDLLEAIHGRTKKRPRDDAVTVFHTKTELLNTQLDDLNSKYDVFVDFALEIAEQKKKMNRNIWNDNPDTEFIFDQDNITQALEKRRAKAAKAKECHSSQETHLSSPQEFQDHWKLTMSDDPNWN